MAPRSSIVQASRPVWRAADAASTALLLWFEDAEKFGKCELAYDEVCGTWTQSPLKKNEGVFNLLKVPEPNSSPIKGIYSRCAPVSGPAEPAAVLMPVTKAVLKLSLGGYCEAIYRKMLGTYVTVDMKRKNSKLAVAPESPPRHLTQLEMSHLAYTLCNWEEHVGTNSHPHEPLLELPEFFYNKVRTSLQEGTRLDFSDREKGEFGLWLTGRAKASRYEADPKMIKLRGSSLQFNRGDSFNMDPWAAEGFQAHWKNGVKRL